MAPTLEPRTYALVDRATKLVGILAVAAGLARVGGPLSPLLLLVGLLVGSVTVFVDAAE